MKFKVGDKVRALSNLEYSITNWGWEGTVVSVGLVRTMRVTGPGLGALGSDGAQVEVKYFELIKSKEKKTMGIDTSIVEKLASFLRSEPEKGLMEAGVITKVEGDYRFTQAGWDLLKTILMEEYKDKLREMVAPIVDEKRAKKA